MQSQRRRIFILFAMLLMVTACTPHYRDGIEVSLDEELMLAEDVSLRVFPAEAAEFTGVSVIGEPLAYTVEFQLGKEHSAVVIQPSPDPKTSDILLQIGEERIPPSATKDSANPRVISTDKLLLSPKTGKGSLMYLTPGQLRVSFLFDAPSIRREEESLLLTFGVGQSDYHVKVELD